MPQTMYIIALSVSAAIVLGALAVAIFSPAAEPERRLKPYASDAELFALASELGRACGASDGAKESVADGAAVSVRGIRRRIDRAYRLLKAKNARGELKAAYECALFDGYRKISEAIESCAASMRELATLPHLNGRPRVCLLAELIVGHRDGCVTAGIVRGAAEAFGSECPLTVAENRALGTALTLALVGFTAIFADRCVRIDARRRKGEADGAAKRADVCALRSAAYLAGAWSRADDAFRLQLKNLCFDNGFDILDRVDDFCSFTDRYALSVSAAVESLDRINSQMGAEFLLSLQPVDAYFARECGAEYTQTTLGTRQMYLTEVEKRARRKNQSELKTAREAVALAEGEGRDLAFALLPKRRGGLWQRVLTASELAAAGALCYAAWAIFPEQKLLAALLVAPIALMAADRAVCAFLLAFVRRRTLPYKDINFVPKETGAVIVCSRLIASAAEAEDALSMLATVACANPDERFSYALLADLPAAKEASADGDAEIIDALRRGIARMKCDRFNLLVRKRTFLKEKNIYQGWEKKRGALLDLNSLILRGEREKFAVIEGDSYKKKYAIALDSDTLLNCAVELVELMEHPYNAQTNVMALVMRSTPRSADATPFSRVLSGASGLDGYTRHHFDLHHDLFGAGNYTGKGIYRVREFDAAVGEAFPDNRIVSHDFIEGAFAGCAQCDESALDSFPSDFSVYFARRQRWLRGDWQLLPYLRRKVKNAAGDKMKNPLSHIAKWHIFLNIFLSLAPVVSLALIAAAPFMARPIYWCGAALLPYALEAAFSLVSITRPLCFARNIASILLGIVMLPVTALGNLRSIGVTLFRLVRRRGLLEWKVCAHERSGGGGMTLVLLLTGLALMTVNAFFARSIAVFALSFAFLTGVPLRAVMSERGGKRAPKKPADLALIAAHTWNFFVTACTERTNFLPPDNYCERGERGFCDRTSPTDIGMALVAAYSARELGIISAEEARLFIARVVSTLKRMEKWRGNLYNWYDVRTLRPLPPGYVSSVDSGNLVCALILAAKAADPLTAEAIAELVSETDLGAFYDETRSLMNIGYLPAENRFDGHYDLVASEASSCCLIAIGLGKIPRASWYALGRRAVRFGASTLYSWTGGAFEYLLTPMFFDYRRGTLLGAAASGAVRAQIKHAAKLGLPYWGASESQYLAFEDNGDYKYRAFGVPGIALSEHAEGSVTAPYACVLALRYAPKAAARNIAAMLDGGLLGRFGLFEAVDGGTAIESYMAHHQGMVLGAICNYLTGGNIVAAMREHPAVRAAELLLGEPYVRSRPRRRPEPAARTAAAENVRRCTAVLTLPTVGLYGSNDYGMVIDERGRGYSIMGRYNATRKRRGCGFLALVDCEGERFDLTGSTDACFYGERAEFSFCRGPLAGKVTARTLTAERGEMRAVRLTNRSSRPLRLTLTFACEPVLGEHADDLAHREYRNMFIKTRVTSGAAVAWSDRSGLRLGLHAEGEGVSYNCSRRAFYGRSEGAADGCVLDPVLSASVPVELAAGESKEVCAGLVAARSETALTDMLARVSSRGYFAREQSKKASDKVVGAAACERAAVLLYGGASYKGGETGALNTALPTVYLGIDSERSLARATEEMKIYAELYRFGIPFDLMIGYRERYGYLSGLETAVGAAVERLGLRRSLPPGCRVRVFNTLTEPELKRICERCTPVFGVGEPVGGDLRVSSAAYPSKALALPKIVVPAGKGGFTADGSFLVDVTDSLPPKPWSNVVAFPRFGTLMTESGGGYTYVGNSRENKLTEWSNDAVLDPPSEFVLLGERGIIWSATKAPASRGGKYAALHSFGFTRYFSSYNAVTSTLTEFVGRTAVKYYKLELTNDADAERRVNATLCLRLVLGDFAEKTAHSLVYGRDGDALNVRNVSGGTCCSVECDRALVAYTFSERVLLSRDGEYVRLTGLHYAEDGFLAYTTELVLPPGGSATAVFTLSAGDEPHPEMCDEILAEVSAYFSSLGCVRAETGRADLDLIYKWLPYQVLCSRFNGRTGFYQAGGAFGFRDQLQDAMALLYVDPGILRAHIIECAAHQFEAGDVQHWWHPDCAGVRTHIVDDRLFLPLAVAEYVRFTRDESVLDERVRYLRDVKLGEREKSAYTSPGYTDRTDTVREHCLRAILSTERGESGLVLMKGGDWNDAMDEVGALGKGVSVFATMLLHLAIKEFLPFSGERADFLRTEMLELREAIDGAWEGDRYRRAVTDDGRVLGSRTSAECKIDVLTQAFSVLGGACPRDKCETALSCADELLADDGAGIVKLFAPPFSRSERIGYITDYPAGVRENGGQYTHAAVWFVRAMFALGKTERACELLSMLLPLNHTRTEADVKKYKNEPYVLSADVYAGEHEGEGGWSWYTGAAGWLYRCMTEDLFGLKISGDAVTFSPALPRSVPEATITISRGDCKCKIKIDNSMDKGEWRVKIDGVRYNTATIKLSSSLNGRKVIVFRSIS